MTDPTPRAPGKTTPRGTTRAVCNATLATESSGISVTTAIAARALAAAPAVSADGGVLTATAARGKSLGDKSMAVANNGKTLSLEASRIPMTSSSSANLSNGAACDNVKPAFSSLVSNPNSAV